MTCSRTCLLTRSAGNPLPAPALIIVSAGEGNPIAPLMWQDRFEETQLPAALGETPS
jgi:hypothetical protein